MVGEGFSELKMWNDENGNIVTAAQYGITICIGSKVRNLTACYGIEEGAIGTVVELSSPGTSHFTSNVVGIDFENCGMPTAQLKFSEFEIYDVLSDEYIN